MSRKHIQIMVFTLTMLGVSGVARGLSEIPLAASVWLEDGLTHSFVSLPSFSVDAMKTGEATKSPLFEVAINEPFRIEFKAPPGYQISVLQPYNVNLVNVQIFTSVAPVNLSESTFSFEYQNSVTEERFYAHGSVLSQPSDVDYIAIVGGIQLASGTIFDTVVLEGIFLSDSITDPFFIMGGEGLWRYYITNIAVDPGPVIALVPIPESKSTIFICGIFVLLSSILPRMARGRIRISR